MYETIGLLLFTDVLIVGNNNIIIFKMKAVNLVPTI